MNSPVASSSTHLRTAARLAGQAKLGSAADFGKVLDEVVATVSSQTDAKRTMAAAPTAGASPAAQGGTASSDVSTDETDVPAVSARPFVAWAQIASGIKSATPAASGKLGVTQAVGVTSGSKDAASTSDGDTAIRTGQDGTVSSPAPAVPEIGAVDPSQSATQASPQPATGPDAAPVQSVAEDPGLIELNPASPGDRTTTLVAQQTAALPATVPTSAPTDTAVQTSAASTVSRSGSTVPGVKATAPSVAFWSPLKVVSNSPPSDTADAATVSGGNRGAGSAPEAAHSASSSGTPSTVAASDTAAVSTGTRAEPQTEDLSAKTLLNPAAAAAGSLGLSSDSGAAAVASTVTQVELVASAGAETTAGSQIGSREHGHANEVSAGSTEPAPAAFTAAGEPAAPGTPPSASPASMPSTSASSARDPAAVSTADQAAPALTAMVQGRNIGRALSVSVTPDNLGSVSITVSRAADGTSVIQLGAERMSTLEMLHTGQAELGQSLDQAGISHGNHALTFAWNGADAGSSWAGAQSGQREQHGEQRPALFAPSAEDSLTRSQDIVADTDRVDVTA